MGKKTVIREMIDLDVPAVANIERLSFAFPWSEEALRQELENSLACYYILENNKELIGYIGTWVIFDEAQVTNVAIHPDFQNKGFGRKLLAYFFTQMKSKGMNVVTLEVRPSNGQAIKLYEQFGFKEIGRRKEYYSDNKEDALIFEVKINES